MVDTNGSSWSTYLHATADEVIAHFTDGGGANHLAFIMAQARPALYARGRAVGYWDANEGALCSAYERLADLIDSGAITTANAGAGHKLHMACRCGTCTTARRTVGRAWA